MKREFNLLVQLLVIPLLFSCAQSNYVGKTYPPTTNVDLFLEEQSITRQYELMGHIIVDGSDIISAEKLQEKMVEEAKNKGADAVLILGLEEILTESATTTSGTSSKDEKGDKRYQERTYTSTSKQKILKADFLKYTD